MAKVFYLMLLAVLCLQMSGCSKSEFLDIQGSISVPNLSSDEQHIREIISEYSDGRFILKHPQTGDFRSAITIESLSPNGEEAVVLYQSGSELAEIHVMVLHKQNEIWRVAGDVIVYKTSVNSINFTDVDNDGFREIIINWSNVNINNNDVSIYKYDSNKVMEIPIPEGFK